MRQIDFRMIPGFSRLFIDFIENQPFFDSRFPSNRNLFNSFELLKKRGNLSIGKNQLTKAIRTSMEYIPLSEKQTENLRKIESETALAVVTGQQAGFLGGPLYTLIKAIDTISISEKLTENYTALSFIPIFWVEDNDHDNLEASVSYLADSENTPREISCCPGCRKSDRTIIARRYFDKSIRQYIKDVESILPDSEFKMSIMEYINDIYKPAKSWSQCFLELMNLWLASEGILFISASVVRESGLFDEFSLRELEAEGQTNDLIAVINSLIEAAGYHIQAKSAPVNLFLHKGDKRLKIKKQPDKIGYDIEDKLYKINDLINIAKNQPGAFSPNVLLRPVFQDKVIPTVAYIGGPSEIGYCCQVRELYEFFGIEMPAFIPRHSATFLIPYIAQFLVKNEYPAEFFFSRFDQIEAEIRNKYYDTAISDVMSESAKLIGQAFALVSDGSVRIDPTLKGAAGAALRKSMEQMEYLNKKIASAQKKKFSETFDKHKVVHNMIFPEGNLQERYFSPIVFMNKIGTAEFINKCKELMSKSRAGHIIVEF